ncbi:hypothetical protein MMC07_000013 [Pseudocyphellaria aurata]|nr:hypothetical protein [Pseudocyphellaria aurata]
MDRRTPHVSSLIAAKVLFGTSSKAMDATSSVYRTQFIEGRYIKEDVLRRFLRQHEVEVGNDHRREIMPNGTVKLRVKRFLTDEEIEAIENESYGNSGDPLKREADEARPNAHIGQSTDEVTDEG